jgi:hypothetical protein
MCKDEAATEIEAGRARLRNLIERMAEEHWAREVFAFAAGARRRRLFSGVSSCRT